jgi:hypothetical protein
MFYYVFQIKVSTLYGLARVFNAEKYSMTVGGDFVKAWTLLLEYMEKAALNRNVEVCISSKVWCSRYLFCYRLIFFEKSSLYSRL